MKLMKKMLFPPKLVRLLFVAGTLVSVFAWLMTAVGPAVADEPATSADLEAVPAEVKECAACHLNVTKEWQTSPHAHAYDDPVFQEWWHGQGRPGECLLCHTTGYHAGKGTFTAEGVTCEACHGQVDAGHPPAVIPVRTDTEFCGSCHTPTLSEWRLSGHGSAGIGCISCHDPHNQLPLFANPDDLCLNCHEGDMGDYLEDVHIQKGIGCVACHTLVIPPEVMPVDGLVPTGHQFTITAATCVACHTDTLHAGFSLPGYERGARVAAGEAVTTTLSVRDRPPGGSAGAHSTALEQQIQLLEAALASRDLTAVFQAGVIGLVFGATTAWFVAHNLVGRRRPQEDGEPAVSGD
jgi:predicted CXXCH cytochrome family protein